jgi:hypothetical protein
MLQTTSAASGSSRTIATAGSQLSRQDPAIRATAHLTIRLPDVSTPRESKRSMHNVAQQEPSIEKESAATETPPAAAMADVLTDAVRSSLWSTDRLPEKVIAFVRQPKFWLSCIAAIAVQVILAAVMTPAQQDQSDLKRTAAKAWQDRAPAPATRIVVPPASTSEVVEPTDGANNGTTTPLGLMTPPEPSSDFSTGTGSKGLSDADLMGSPSHPTLMAENRRMTDEARQFDGQRSDRDDGATLGSIVPLETPSELNTSEPRQ